MLDLNAHLVAECHLAYSFRSASAFYCICRKDLSSLDIFKQLSVAVHDLGVIRQIIVITVDLKFYDLASCFLKFRSNDVLAAVYIYCKGNKCRRYIDLTVFIIKGTGHTVLTADGRKSKAHLRIVSTRECCKWLAPSGWVAAHSAEVFLESKADLFIITACSHDLCYRRDNCINSAMVWAPAGKIWIKAVAHHGNGICMSF